MRLITRAIDIQSIFEFLQLIHDFLDNGNIVRSYVYIFAVLRWLLSLLFPVFGNHCFYSEKLYNNVKELKMSMMLCKKYRLIKSKKWPHGRGFCSRSVSVAGRLKHCASGPLRRIRKRVRISCIPGGCDHKCQAHKSACILS